MCQVFVSGGCVESSFATVGVREPKRGQYKKALRPLGELVNATPVTFSAEFSGPGSEFESTGYSDAPVAILDAPHAVYPMLVGRRVFIRSGTPGERNKLIGDDLRTTESYAREDIDGARVAHVYVYGTGEQKVGVKVDAYPDITFVCKATDVVDLTCPKCKGAGHGEFDGVKGKCYRCRGKGWMDARDRETAHRKGYATPMHAADCMCSDCEEAYMARSR